MNSIRKRLTLSLLLALGVIWAVSQGFVYHAIRKATISSFDKEMEPIVNDVRFFEGPRPMRMPPPSFDESPNPMNEPGGERSGLFREEGPPGPPPDEEEFRGPEEFSQRAKLFSEKDSGLYFQIIRFGEAEERVASPSLGDHEIPLLVEAKSKPQFYDFQLPSGENLRVLAERHPRFMGPGRRPGERREEIREYEIFMVARSRQELDASLNSYLVAFVVVGAIGAIITVLIVNYLLGHGLKPLNSLARQVDQIDGQSLDARLSVPNNPKELVPITDRLNDLLERLHASFERERRFSSDASHELRTPVSELRALAEVSLRWPTSITKEHFASFLAISQRMESTLDGLLKLSRLDANQMNKDLEQIDLSQLATRSLNRIRERAEAKALTLKIQLLDDLLIDSNPDLIDLILNNLLANLVEYAPEASCASLTLEENGNRFLLAFENEAPALDATDVKALFQRFWRKDESRTSAEHSGLGLSIAHSAAKALQLDLTAELTPQGRLLIALSGKKSSN